MKIQPSNGSCDRTAAGVAVVLLLLLSACSQKSSCDDAGVVDKMLNLASKGVAADLASQCVSSLYKKIPQVSSSCPTALNAESPTCLNACDAWAKEAIKASASKIETTFSTDSVATISCRAAVRFDIDYDGGQRVDTRISYLVAPQSGGLQVALSQ